MDVAPWCYKDGWDWMGVAWYRAPCDANKHGFSHSGRKEYLDIVVNI